MDLGLVLLSLAGGNSCNPMILLVKIIKELLLFRYGQRETAGKIMEDMLATGDSNFNHLHKEVLLFNNENLRPFREISVRKKPWDNMQVSPGHNFFFFKISVQTLNLFSLYPLKNIPNMVSLFPDYTHPLCGYQSKSKVLEQTTQRSARVQYIRQATKTTNSLCRCM